MLDVVTHSYDNINDGLFSGIVLVDLNKHSILSFTKHLLKLRNYGICGMAFDLLNLYLSNRNSLYVSIIADLNKQICQLWGTSGIDSRTVVFPYINNLHFA